MFKMNLLIKKSIPNFITLSNLFLGFTSIVLLSLSLSGNANHYINTACYLILISSVLDAFDGKVARKLNISSDFGKEIDSLADLISFCLVPSFLLFVWYSKMSLIQLIPLVKGTNLTFQYFLKYLSDFDQVSFFVQFLNISMIHNIDIL